MLKLCEPDYDIAVEYEPHEHFAETPTKFQPIHSSSLQQSTLLSFRHHPVASLPTEAIDALQISSSRSPPPTVQKCDSIARSLTDQPTCSLHHEFSLLNTNIPHVEVDILDAIKRYAIFKISSGGHVVILQVRCGYIALNGFILFRFFFFDRQHFLLIIQVQMLDQNL